MTKTCDSGERDRPKRLRPVGRPPEKPEVHVWRLCTDGVSAPLLSRLTTLLDARERELAARLPGRVTSERFVVRRARVRQVLARYTGRAPAALVLGRDPDGRPFLQPSPRQLDFSVSHSGDAVLVAVSRAGRVGVDLERHRVLAAAGRFADRFLHPEEAAQLSGLAPAFASRALLGCWTRKEAYLKAAGPGIPAGLASCRVTVPPRPPALLAPANGRWVLRDLAPLPGHAATVAWEGHASDRVRVFGYAEDGEEFLEGEAFL